VDAHPPIISAAMTAAASRLPDAQIYDITGSSTAN
jgi:hypothetical protein